MALPAVLLKAKKVLTKAGQAKQVKDAVKSEDGSATASTVGLIGAGCGCAPLGCLIFFLMIFIVGFSNIFGAIQFVQSLVGEFVDGITSTIGNLVLNDDTLKNYYDKTEKAPITSNNPSVDLKSTEYKTVENFNEHIKQNVQNAGYGTRAGVVAAGVSLISDYISATGKRLRYSQGSRQEQAVDGIVNENFYLDCSSFAWWALYNGGFKRPTDAYTGSQKQWAINNNCLTSVNNGQAGDFLIVHNDAHQHIILIIGTYNGGYYCAEFKGIDYGGVISKRSISDLRTVGYQVINMEKYYSNSSNVRK